MRAVSAFGIVHKSLNPRNVAAVERVAARAETAGAEQSRNLPIQWAKGKLKAREAGKDMSRRLAGRSMGVERHGLSKPQLQRVNPWMAQGNAGQNQAKAALRQVRAPSKRNLP